MNMWSFPASRRRGASAALAAGALLLHGAVSPAVARADAGTQTASAIVAAAQGQLADAALPGAGPCAVGGGYYARGSGQTSSCTAWGTEAHAWCADFVGWVWQRAGVLDLGTLDDLAAGFKDYGLINGTWSSAPATGDALYYHAVSAHGTQDDHVVIVTAINPDGTLDTIGGNELSPAGVVREDTGMPSAVGAVAWLDGKVPVQVDGYAAPVAPLPKPPSPPPATAPPTAPGAGADADAAAAAAEISAAALADLLPIQMFWTEGRP